MQISYQDLIYINAGLRAHHIRYRVRYKNETTACLEPPGECCCTPEQRRSAVELIREYYQGRGVQVAFSEDRLYFTLKREP